MRRVKICGVNSEAALEASVEAAADYIGFVFFQRSPRVVTARQAVGLSGRYKIGPKRVGLFVNPDPAEIEAVLDLMKLDVLQIYADEAACKAAAEMFGLPVWRPVGVQTALDLPRHAGAESGYIIESRAPADAARPGGNAVPMNWGLLNGWESPLPWLLAGGLTADNVIEAVTTSGARGVDVSSGVETLPGVKSPALIRRFITNARLAGAINARNAERQD
jgi:phosphoribosylanthranilate isomerase